MTIESKPVSSSVTKTSQAAACGKGKAAPAVAGDTLGFFAMLSAADDALALSADAAGLTYGPGVALANLEPEEDDSLALQADVSALTGWILGGRPIEPDATLTGDSVAPTAGGAFASVRRPIWSMQDSEAQSGGLLSANARKVGKSIGTADLQKVQDGAAASLPLVHEDATRKLLDSEMARVQEVVSIVGLEGREPLVPVNAQSTTVERRALDPLVSKAAPADGTYFQTQATSAPMGMDGVVATQSSQSLEAYVAEQVTYWIAQDVQNAELTLDGMGFSPVEVSISMQGNEAQVAFRTDELHARDAIENASEQLKDALQRQGVLLTGMSVGTSGSGDTSGQGRRSRPEGRQAAVEVLTSLPVDSPVTAKATQGRALDLFV